MFYSIMQLLAVSITATTAMTWFSYMVSNSFRELYKEPVLLSYAINKLNLNLSDDFQKTWGWLLHYVIGFIFVLAYHIIWENEIMPISTLSAIILGIISGIIGIISWKLIFTMTNHQPRIDFKGYYIQLFIAHMIFAAVATALYSFSITILELTSAYVTL